MKLSNRSPEQPICSAGETCYVTRNVTLISTRSLRAVPKGDPGRAAPVMADSARAFRRFSSKPLRIRTDE
jgi:hypothetical protein